MPGRCAPATCSMFARARGTFPRWQGVRHGCVPFKTSAASRRAQGHWPRATDGASGIGYARRSCQGWLRGRGGIVRVSAPGRIPTTPARALKVRGLGAGSRKPLLGSVDRPERQAYISVLRERNTSFQSERSRLSMTRGSGACGQLAMADSKTRRAVATSPCPASTSARSMAAANPPTIPSRSSWATSD